MKRCAVLIPIRHGEVLLGFKKTGFGAGKIIEMGGKIEPGETPEDAARRELHEEAGLHARSIEPRGEVILQFRGRPEWDMHVHVFTTHDWTGEPGESDEVTPQWHRQDALPYSEMWSDAPHWLPDVLEGRRVALRFVLAEDGETLSSVEPLQEMRGTQGDDGSDEGGWL